MIELTQIMRQKDDQPFIELLDRFRTASQNDEDIQCINLTTTSSSDDNYPSNALHVWAENILEKPTQQYKIGKHSQTCVCLL